MDYRDVAAEILSAVGGTQNVADAMTCLTRLRLTLNDASLVDVEAIRPLPGVLGVAPHGTNRLEVIFGPATIESIGREFALVSGLALNGSAASCANPLSGLDAKKPETADQSRGLTQPGDNGPITITAGRKQSYRAQQRAAIADERLSKEDIDSLKAFLETDNPEAERKVVRLGSTPARPLGRSVLVINGPNINMLGMREPAIYGRQDYATLVATCRDAAKKAGFSDVRCYQSNHEGDLVDEIQGALGTFDGIVINPGAYTHTSIAILDAVKAVGLPCVEVHISKVEEREDFRQVSYIRKACFETITGMGIDGYRKAIFDLATYLGM